MSVGIFLPGLNSCVVSGFLKLLRSDCFITFHMWHLAKANFAVEDLLFYVVYSSYILRVVLLKTQLVKLIKTVIFKGVQAKYLTIKYPKLLWVDLPSFLWGKKGTWNILSLGGMKRIVSRSPLENGGILHGLLDLAFPHSKWVIVRISWRLILFFLLLSQCITAEADVTCVVCLKWIVMPMYSLFPNAVNYIYYFHQDKRSSFIGESMITLGFWVSFLFSLFSPFFLTEFLNYFQWLKVPLLLIHYISVNCSW